MNQKKSLLMFHVWDIHYHKYNVNMLYLLRLIVLPGAWRFSRTRETTRARTTSGCERVSFLCSNFRGYNILLAACGNNHSPNNKRLCENLSGHFVSIIYVVTTQNFIVFGYVD